MKKGMSLVEVMIAAAIAAILTLALAFLFVQTSAFSREGGRSLEEMLEIGKAMRAISETLSVGSVYLARSQDAGLLRKGSSRITIQQFFEISRQRKVTSYSFENGKLFKRAYAPGPMTLKPEKETVIAKSLKDAVFLLTDPGVLRVTLEGEGFSLQTEIPNIGRASR